MPEIGDFLVTRTGSWVGWAIRWFTHSPVNHAAIYIGMGMIVEAQPHGAELGSVKRYPKAIWSKLPLTPVQRDYLHDQAVELIGTPYNWLDVAAQAIVRLFEWHAPKWAIKRLSRPDRLQCAQLVDLCYERAGIELFPDGRPGGLVSPEDLRQVILRG